MSDQHEGQWTNDRINTHADDLADAWFEDVEAKNLLSDDIAMSMAKVRGDLQAQIDALRKELAGRVAWEPLEDGTYDVHLSNGNINEFKVSDDSITLIAFSYYGEMIDSGWINTGDYRLCRRLTPASQEAAVGVAAQEETNAS